MPTSERTTPTSRRVSATATHSGMEVGNNEHGFL